MVTEEELGLVNSSAKDALAFAREVLALRKDAERYKKLRDSALVDVRIICVGKRSGQSLDAAVDELPAVRAA